MKAAIAPEPAPASEDAAAVAIEDNVERLAPEDQRGLETQPRALLRRFIRCLYLAVVLVFAYAAVTVYLLPYQRVRVSMAEFESLFEMIGINIPASKREQLFAYMDASGDGWISEKEFRAGWSKMTIDFVKAMAAEEGLSNRQILIVVLYTLTILSLVFVFILLTLTSWNTTSTFQSTVQSGLVGSLGKATTALRTRARAETEDLSNLIDTKIDIQEEIAADDGNFGGSTEQSG